MGWGIEVLIPLSAFAAIVWVIHILAEGFRRRHQTRLATDFHAKLLDRIGSAKEFGEFLNSTGGTKFLDSLTIEREGGAQTRILRAVQAGLVFVALGIGLFLLIGNITLTTQDVVNGEIIQSNAESGFAIFATLSTSIGVGLLLSAGVSYVLSKRMGLMDGRDSRTADSVHSA